MSVSGSQMVDCMAASSLPSTLVKCIYLFYDLPAVEENDKIMKQQRHEFEETFSSLLMTALQSSPSTSDELARKTDLMLLITAASSYCPEYNKHWHKTAVQATACVAKFGLKPSVVSFLHSKGSIGIWVENLKQIGPPPDPNHNQMMDYVDMVLALVGFIQESANTCSVFLDDFKKNDGYGLIARTIFAIEAMPDGGDHATQLIRNLMLAASLQLSTAGSPSDPLPPIPQPQSTLHVIPGFAPPSNREGASSNCLAIRFVTPLQLLSAVFNGAKSDSLCLLVLECINNLFQQEMNNYFWLEQESLLSDLLLKLPHRSLEVQTLFFQILEQVVTNLNYVPIKELNSIAMVFKQTGLSTQCRLAMLSCLARLSTYSSTFSDAYRDVGLIELIVNEVQRLAPNAKLYTTEHEQQDSIDEEKDEFTLLTNAIDLLTLLVAASSKNADVIREVEGTKTILKLVAEEPSFRMKSLMLLQSIILANAGDEEMTQLLLLAQTCSLTDLDLKSHIFKVVVSILRQNHRCRSMFRRVAGFVYTVSILVQLEGALSDQPKEPWNTVKTTDILVLVRLIFSTLTIVMRYEPANARHFAVEVKYSNLSKAVRQLGCFRTDDKISINETVIQHVADQHNCDFFSALFHSVPELPQSGALPKILYAACLLLRFLLDMACDLLDRTNVKSGLPSPRPHSTSHESDTPLSIDILEIEPQSFSALSIVHPGAISAMIHLIPDIYSETKSEAALDLQWFLLNRISDLLIGMRNQQVMAEAGLASEILQACPLALADEKHFMHKPLVTIFEKISGHWMSTTDLKSYLRLSNPLNCLSPQEKEEMEDAVSTTVPLERVKSLVSINTHRPSPPFVELDMRYEGFGCLFLPSVAPMMANTKLLADNSPSPTPNPSSTPSPSHKQLPRQSQSTVGEMRLLGGVGVGERIYPPSNAISYSCWFCVDQFSNPDRQITSNGATDTSHPIFLLILTKQDGAKDDSNDATVSLAAFLTTGTTERSLIVVTQEQPLTSLVECFDTSPDLSAAVSSVSRFPLSALSPGSTDSTGKWHHLVITLGRPSTVLRYNNNLTVYMDGRQVGSAKTSFMMSTPAFANSVSNMVCGFIGTPPLLRRRSGLRWRLGPVLLAEDLLSANNVSAIYGLGPSYSGSYQSVRTEAKNSGTMASVTQSLVNEDKIMCVLHPSLMSSMTVAKIRKVFSREDGRLAARQVRTFWLKFYITFFSQFF